MGPCRKHVLLQEAVSEGVWRGKRGAYRLIRLRSVVRFLAANGPWEECAEDGLHSGLPVATRCAGGQTWLNMEVTKGNSSLTSGIAIGVWVSAVTEVGGW